MSKCKNERDRMPIEKRAMFAQLPKFLDALKQEVVNEASPIWDANFKPQRKREKENTSSVGGALTTMAGTSAINKKYNEPSSSKKFKRDNDPDDISDEVVLKAIKRINDPNYTNKIEVYSDLISYDSDTHCIFFFFLVDTSSKSST